MSNVNEEKMLVWVDEPVAQRVNKAWERIKEEISRVVVAYKKTGMPELAGPNDLHRLFHDTRKFMFERLIGDNPTLNTGAGSGLQITLEGAMSMIKEPPSVAEMEQLVAGVQVAIGNACLNGMFSWSTAQITRDFVLTKEGVEFTEARKQKMYDAGKCYATTEKGRALARFFTKVAAAFAEEGIHKHVWFRNREKVTGMDLMAIVEKARLQYIDTATGKPIFPNPNNNEHLGWPGDRNDF